VSTLQVRESLPPVSPTRRRRQSDRDAGRRNSYRGADRPRQRNGM